MAQVESFFNQMEYDVIHQWCLTSSFFSTAFNCAITLFSGFLHGYICLDIYTGSAEVEAIEM